jgi:quercetin dioxygenase-like cupin family protein
MVEIIKIGGIEIRFLNSKHDTGGALDLFEVTVQANARVPVPHYHRDWEETVYGLQGTITFTVAGKPHDIGTGETLFIPRGVVHGFVNKTQAPAKCLSVLTPGVLGPEYFREMAAALSSDAPPDPKKLGEIMNRFGLVPAPAG